MLFSIDRLNSSTILKVDYSATLGFDYKLKNLDKELNFSIGQVINEKENKNMPELQV